MTWTIADDVLTTTVTDDGIELSVDLTQHTIASLVGFLASQPGYAVLYLDTSPLALLGAVALVEGSGDILTSNGDHIYVATNPNWSLMDGYSKELGIARAQIIAMPLEMSTTTADGEWLDLLGSYYGIPRLLGEPDSVYAPRIPAEVILPRQNNVAIEIALETATGQPSLCTDAVVYGNPTPIFDGSIRFDATHFFNASAARVYNLFDVVTGYPLLGNATPADFLVGVRAQIDRLRAAGTHLRNLTLGPSVLRDSFFQPTDQIVENWNFGLGALTASAISYDSASAMLVGSTFVVDTARTVSTDSATGNITVGAAVMADLHGEGLFVGRPVAILQASATLSGDGSFTGSPQ